MKLAYGFVLLGILLTSQVFAQTRPSTAPAAVRSGRILTPDGRALAGAKVSLVSELHSRGDLVLAEVITDADGQFRVSATTDRERTYLLAQASGYGLTIAAVSSAGDTEPAQTRIQHPTELTVQFVGSDGLPAAGAVVTISRIQAGRAMEIQLGQLSSEMRQRYTQVADGNGICHFPDLPQGATAVLDVVDERFAKLGRTQLARLGETIATDGGMIRLDPAGRLSGRLFYQDTGQPLAGVLVSADMERVGMDLCQDRAITDADGRFVIKQLRTGSYLVRPSLSEEVYSHHAYASLRGVRVVAGQEAAGQDLALVPGEIIRGKVTVKESGRPLAGVSVMNVLTGEDGTYEARALPGSQTVYLYLRNREHFGRFTENQMQRQAVVVAGQVTTVDFEMTEIAAAGVSGQVRDVQGNPVAGAQVTLEDERPNSVSNIAAQALSDSSGNYSIPAARTGAKLRARKGEAMTAQATPVTDGDRIINLVIATNVAGSIRVVVTTPTGAPAAGAKVTLMERRGQFRVGSEEKFAREDGSVVIESLTPGETYGLGIGGNGFSRSFLENLAIQPGQRLELQATVSRAEAAIAGVVLDPAGKPVPDITVRIDGETVDIVWLRSDAQGRFRYQGLMPDEIVAVDLQLDERTVMSRTQVRAGTMDAVIRYNPPNVPRND